LQRAPDNAPNYAENSGYCSDRLDFDMLCALFSAKIRTCTGTIFRFFLCDISVLFPLLYCAHRKQKQQGLPERFHHLPDRFNLSRQPIIKEIEKRIGGK
jgi:hypothetical protein